MADATQNAQSTAAQVANSVATDRHIDQQTVREAASAAGQGSGTVAAADVPRVAAQGAAIHATRAASEQIGTGQSSGEVKPGDLDTAPLTREAAIGAQAQGAAQNQSIGGVSAAPLPTGPLQVAPPPVVGGSVNETVVPKDVASQLPFHSGEDTGIVTLPGAPFSEAQRNEIQEAMSNLLNNTGTVPGPSQPDGTQTRHGTAQAAGAGAAKGAGLGG